MQPERDIFELLVVDGFVPVEVSTVLDIVRIAGRYSPAQPPELRITQLGPTGMVYSVDEHMAVLASARRTDSETPDVLIVAGGAGVAERRSDILQFVSKALTRGVEVVLLSDAARAWATATKGASNATLHWEDRRVLSEDGAWDGLSAVLYRRNGRVTTSAGMMATSDTLLGLLSARYSDLLAQNISRNLLMDRIRPGETPQADRLADLPGYNDQILRRVIDHMEQNLTEPITSRDLSRVAEVSVRQVERLFRKHLGRSPFQFLRDLRLNQARLLLETTNLSLSDIAIASGLGSNAHLSKRFRRAFGAPPNAFRRTLSQAGTARSGGRSPKTAASENA